MSPLIYSDSLFLTYFFEELNIVDYQQAVSFVKQVKKPGAQYYNELNEIRKSKCDEVLKALPDVAREKYKELFGNPYDYEAEKISAWDEMRK